MSIQEAPEKPALTVRWLCKWCGQFTDRPYLGPDGEPLVKSTTVMIRTELNRGWPHMRYPSWLCDTEKCQVLGGQI